LATHARTKQINLEIKRNKNSWHLASRKPNVFLAILKKKKAN
jgi:hypothetical protein